MYHDGARERHSEKMRRGRGGIGRSGDSEASAMKAQFWSVTEAHSVIRDWFWREFPLPHFVQQCSYFHQEVCFESRLDEKP